MLIHNFELLATETKYHIKGARDTQTCIILDKSLFILPVCFLTNKEMEV